MVGHTYKQVLELLTQTELAAGPVAIKRVLGLTDDGADDVSEIDNYFKSYIALARGPITVGSRDYAPEADNRLNWVLAYGLEAWQAFVRRMQEQGKTTLERVNASGRRKVRLRQTEKFEEQ